MQISEPRKRDRSSRGSLTSSKVSIFYKRSPATCKKMSRQAEEIEGPIARAVGVSAKFNLKLRGKGSSTLHFPCLTLMKKSN